MKTKLTLAILALLLLVGCGGNTIGRGPDGTGTIEPIKTAQ